MIRTRARRQPVRLFVVPPACLVVAQHRQGVPGRREAAEGAHLQHHLLDLGGRGPAPEGPVDVCGKLLAPAEHRQGRDGAQQAGLQVQSVPPVQVVHHVRHDEALQFGVQRAHPVGGLLGGSISQHGGQNSAPGFVAFVIGHVSSVVAGDDAARDPRRRVLNRGCVLLTWCLLSVPVRAVHLSACASCYHFPAAAGAPRVPTGCPSLLSWQ